MVVLYSLRAMSPTRQYDSNVNVNLMWPPQTALSELEMLHLLGIPCSQMHMDKNDKGIGCTA